MFRQAMGWLGLLFCLASVPVSGQQVGTATQTKNQQSQGPNLKTNGEEIEKLITQLGNRNFAAREAASKTLEDMGLEALPALRKAASAAADAEVRRRAGDLVQTIERLHEAEIEFAWFDGLGFPDLAKCKFVRVTTGHYYHERDGTAKNFYDFGFLVRDDGSRFTVLDAYLWTHYYTKSDSQRAEHEKVTYEAWDLEKETTLALKSLQLPEDKDAFPRRFGERLTEPAELFVWARVCAAQGKPKLADQLLAQAKRNAEKRAEGAKADRTFHQIIADDIAHAQMWQAVEAFGDPAVSRRELLARFDLIVKHFPRNLHWNRAKEAAELLKKMVEEDEAHARNTVKATKEITKEERIAQLIFRLRDQNGHQFMQPGHCDVFAQGHLGFEGGEKSPAQQLVDIGYDAVPQLIAVLEDDRFTRSVGFQRDFYFSHFVLRVGDCAEAVLERIAGRSFWEPRSTSAAMLKDGQANIVKAKVQEWWQEFQEKGEKQMLIDGVRAGDYDSPKQAKRLAKKYPDSAVPAIRQGVKSASQDWVAKSLVENATELKGEPATAFLREQLHGSYLLCRVAAARGLLERSRDEAIDAMIAEWNNAGKVENHEDLINFLLWCGKAEAVKALAKDLHNQSIDIRLRVIEAVYSPPWWWEKQQKSLGQEVEQAIDEVLIEELDDCREQTRMTGIWGGKEVSDPRLCDLSGHVLAQRWKQPSWFDLSASQKTRDRQRVELKSIWLKKQRKEP
jgi:hypothetical protein